jgi:hypothetical protein
MKLGIAIPCFIKHIPNLWILLEALNNQTILPNKVAVSCSSTDCIQLPKKYNFPLVISITPDYKNVSQNRNIAISQLSDMDYISFIDADDIPHYQRNEIILKTINDNHSDIILHNFMIDNVNLNTQITSINYKHNVLCQSPSGCIMQIKYEDECIYKIHHAQSTVRREICNKVLYDESDKSVSKEDCVFCYSIFSIPNIKNSYIYNELSYYFPSNTSLVWQ